MNLSNNNEETFELASKTWNRVINSATKTGYREGIKDGSLSVFQEGFDRGYKVAFKTSFLIGVYKALANCIATNLEHPMEIENILHATKKGVCYLCETKTKEDKDMHEKSISEIECYQTEHSDRILKVLQNHYNPLLKELN
ncbi:PREDICTED: uncharacterized protein LOC105367360, partial [Ceratosolen solmsi marchali]|uniref:Uncharacterized protein LOC105367360 n=1 Tax=Ceratosolen solmsi marchali TaxID=326594 RepID=A0AAJ7E1H0_9HYME